MTPQADGDGTPPPIPDHTLLRRIGRGSYGEVWLARNHFGIYRAVKIVSRASFQSQRPFEREMSGIRKFEPISRSHEGFVDILQVGINPGQNYFYYVMELGDAQESSGQNLVPESYAPKTLAKQIALHQRIPFPECLRLGLALTQAVGELHRRGLVHRDIKPANIIFVNGVPKLADIGMVADIHEAVSYVGTEGFIPPEGPGTPQADVYSLGKVLYEASTGKDRQDFPELPSNWDEFSDAAGCQELNEIILQACRRETNQRYPSAIEMHADLVVLENGKSVKRLRLLERRLSALKRTAGIAALVLLVLAGVGYEAYREWKTGDDLLQQQAGANLANGNHALEAGDLMGPCPILPKCSAWTNPANGSTGCGLAVSTPNSPHWSRCGLPRRRSTTSDSVLMDVES
jgi:serine/threonine protein kinase